MTRSSPALLLVPVLLVAIADGLLAANPAREIRGHRTIHGAESSERANPIPPRYVYGQQRDWHMEPYRLAVLLVEFSDTKHQAIHSAALYDEMLFSRERYKRTPGGELSFGSVADWYRVQSSDRFVLSGKVFDWIMVDETFEAIHALKLSEARERYLKVALANARVRDGATALDGFDGYLFVHVGPITGPSGNVFWSHRGDVEGKRYITTGEIERIGVICHEFGHMLGLPDFYGKKGVRESFGPWCAMSGGYRGLYPKSFCAWSKIRLGWCRPTVVDATVAQNLVLRPIQTHENDAFIIPLNTIDGVGAEFLLLENRLAAGNDAEGQAGLFIWRIKRTVDNGPFPSFELALPGPADTSSRDQSTRRVTWPTDAASKFEIAGDGKESGVALRNIRKENDLIFFEVGPP